MSESRWALGLMSGTSLDGIDAALIRTDGVEVAEFGPWLTLPYVDRFRARLRGVMAGEGNVADAERELTLLHAEAVRALLQKAGARADEIRVIGFHGQTIAHRPEKKMTRQIGDGALLARETGIDVVCDFRSADIAAGGQGAPLAPLYHAALAKNLPKPAVFLNIGGVANVTYIGEELLAFDTGPGNALIDDAVYAETGAACDADGELALSGKANDDLIAQWLAHPFFAAAPPKSLDRNAFDVSAACVLPPPDRVATLTRFTAAAVHAGMKHLPEMPQSWHVCGGGRHNPALMRELRMLLSRVSPVEELGLSGDALEAQAFAYLAVRSLEGLHLSLPGTTGAPAAVTGGTFHAHASRKN